MIAAAGGARAGEIWLLPDTGGSAQMRYSSSSQESNGDPLPSGKPFGVTSSQVDRVVKSGRSATMSGTGASKATHTVIGFPIHSGSDIVGALALVYESGHAASEEDIAAVSAACHHLGGFLERVRAEGTLQETARELSELASTDSLTGLKNRREFDRALRTIPRQPFAILSIDVDHLKLINDRDGHAAGDALLRLVGNTLGLMVRGWDVMARVGGDEFAALLPGVGVFGASLVAERMREAMHVLDLPSGPVRITVGWSAAPAGADPVSVWRVADECLYKAKATGRDAVDGRSYERGEAADLADRSYSDVVVRLLEGGALHTVFQPIVNLNDGSVMGYEALARPEGFAPLDSVEAVFEAARQGGQIRDLDWLCRRRAVADAQSLPREASLFLNMSAAALVDPGHGVDQLLQVLRDVGRTPETVVIEITEHERIRDYAALSGVLLSYRAEGFRFALDDVGEGHSTLELLIASSSEYLKLGRSLTMTSTRSGSRAGIAAVMAFASSSGAVLIAEGVENEFVSDLMKAAGITLGQGFGLGKPTLAADREDVGAALTGRAALSGLRPRRASVGGPNASDT
ncbi:MAG: bifunctional diguanylate cyclase/phosphodiesterase [Candidatus Dormibacteraeota bacterium]|nr:bifunctional diguanylate cyclase/phosphodiesterase [Candidatus Dormibacteraeota bacterium]